LTSCFNSTKSIKGYGWSVAGSLAAEVEKVAFVEESGIIKLRFAISYIQKDAI